MQMIINFILTVPLFFHHTLSNVSAVPGAACATCMVCVCGCNTVCVHHTARVQKTTSRSPSCSSASIQSMFAVQMMSKLFLCLYALALPLSSIMAEITLHETQKVGFINKTAGGILVQIEPLPCNTSTFWVSCTKPTLISMTIFPNKHSIADI